MATNPAAAFRLVKDTIPSAAILDFGLRGDDNSRLCGLAPVSWRGDGLGSGYMIQVAALQRESCAIPPTDKQELGHYFEQQWLLSRCPGETFREHDARERRRRSNHIHFSPRPQ
jgi:hypothetical protein